METHCDDLLSSYISGFNYHIRLLDGDLHLPKAIKLVTLAFAALSQPSAIPLSLENRVRPGDNR